MKRLLYIFIFALLVSCYEEDTETILSEDISHRTSEMSLVLKSMAAHHAAFDDAVDQSSCFSIEIPYQIYLNSELTTISVYDDLLELSDEDSIELIYPVNTVFYNYEEHQATNQTGFNLIKSTCDENYNIIPNPCLDFQFPVTFKEYNDLTESFDTFHFNSNRDIFFYLDTLHDNDVYEIEYPVYLINPESDQLLINSNLELIEAYNASLNQCQ
jgi:hypothetical protein